MVRVLKKHMENQIHKQEQKNTSHKEKGQTNTKYDGMTLFPFRHVGYSQSSLQLPMTNGYFVTRLLAVRRLVGVSKKALLTHS